MQKEVEEILRLIDSLQVADREVFDFGGITYELILLAPEHCEQDMVAWFDARSDTKFDICLPEDLAGSTLKRVLFHEIMEIYLLRMMGQTDAHSVAKRLEEETFG